MDYERFKKETIAASDVITKSNRMRAVSNDFSEGFHTAMWEAREIFMRLEDEEEVELPNILPKPSPNTPPTVSEAARKAKK